MAILFQDNFENTERTFYQEATMDHSFKRDTLIKRSGTYSGRFEIRKTDTPIWGGTRSEFAQAWRTTRPEGWYGFSQYFPDNYIIDPIEEVVGQWHDMEDAGETASRSPSNMISTGNGHLKWTTRWDSRAIQTNNVTEGYFEKDLGVIPKGKWIDWVVHIKYSHTNTGILEVWKDGIKVIDRQNMPNCLNDQVFPYFKFGVYRWEWGTNAEPRIIYYDNIKIGDENSNYNEVAPYVITTPIEPEITPIPTPIVNYKKKKRRNMTTKRKNSKNTKKELNSPELNKTYKAVILKAFDGDTFTAQVDLGLGFGGTVQFNLQNANAHEVRGESLESGRAAKKEVEYLMVGKEVILRTDQSKIKGRYAASIEIDGEDLGEKLIRDGHAKSVEE